MADKIDKNLTGSIIRFPGRSRPQRDATARLDQAIRALDQANTQLRRKVSDWRSVTEELTNNLSTLTESLQVLDTNLTPVLPYSEVRSGSRTKP